MAEFAEDHCGPWMAAISCFRAVFFTINMASMLKGAAKVISQAVGGHVPVNEIVVVMTLVFVLYSFIGGLVAAAWTDFLQGFLIIALSFMLIPLGWTVVGGLDGGGIARAFPLATPSGIGPGHRRSVNGPSASWHNPNSWPRSAPKTAHVPRGRVLTA
jgi:Na+/proline symporter